MPSRAVERAARRLADQQSERIRRLPPEKFNATVSAVTPGAARDSNALVTVTHGGEELLAAGYNAAYTPAVGHRVKCEYVDNQLQIEYQIVGYP